MNEPLLSGDSSISSFFSSITRQKRYLIDGSKNVLTKVFLFLVFLLSDQTRSNPNQQQHMWLLYINSIIHSNLFLYYYVSEYIMNPPLGRETDTTNDSGRIYVSLHKIDIFYV